MFAEPFAPAAAVSAPVPSRGRSLAFAVGGMLAAGFAGLAVYAIAAAPVGLLIGLAGHQTASARQPLLAFDSRTPLASAKILRGVSGEAIPARVTGQADGAMLTPASALATGELALVALDRLSADDCISLTTASGQTLSFRILGAHPSEGPRQTAASSRIDLAVNACSANSEPIRKAVIESKAGAKESAVQRNL
jgi:hypothetical protein